VIKKKPKTWIDFVSEIESIRTQYGSHTTETQNGGERHQRNNILFRGQSNTDWKLRTTLERKTDNRFHISKYLRRATGKSSCVLLY